MKKRGVEELNLISQNSTYFGKDRGKHSQLPALLKEMSGLGFRWLRVLYLMPEEITPEILDGFDRPVGAAVFRPALPACVGAGSEKNEARRRLSKKTCAWCGISGNDFPTPFCAARSSSVSRAKARTISSNCSILPQKPRLERIGVFGFSPEENTASFNLPAANAAANR